MEQAPGRRTPLSSTMRFSLLLPSLRACNASFRIHISTFHVPYQSIYAPIPRHSCNGRRLTRSESIAYTRSRICQAHVRPNTATRGAALQALSNVVNQKLRTHLPGLLPPHMQSFLPNPSVSKRRSLTST
ncbi:hypothetical protein C8Q72DRAFT_615697 [Fomitopsis betulina]|nr:hypothetical protein C8Q72DRAFT_615697 [Fomitopsis betulina]